MMKKLVALMLVLVVGSMASAAFIIEKTADPAMGNIVGDNAMAAYYLTADKGVELDMLYTGALRGITDLSAVQDYIDILGPVNIFQIEFADNALPPATILPIGIVMTVKALEAGDTLVKLHDFDTGDVLGSVVLTPEPMSLMLLGLGGLFLRRRK